MKFYISFVVLSFYNLFLGKYYYKYNWSSVLFQKLIVIYIILINPNFILLIINQLGKYSRYIN